MRIVRIFSKILERMRAERNPILLYKWELFH